MYIHYELKFAMHSKRPTRSDFLFDCLRRCKLGSHFLVPYLASHIVVIAAHCKLAKAKQSGPIHYIYSYMAQDFANNFCLLYWPLNICTVRKFN